MGEQGTKGRDPSPSQTHSPTQQQRCRIQLEPPCPVVGALLNRAQEEVLLEAVESTASLLSPSSKAHTQEILLSCLATYGTVHPSSLYFAPFALTNGFHSVSQLSLPLGSIPTSSLCLTYDCPVIISRSLRCDICICFNMPYRYIFDSDSLSFGLLAFPHKQYFYSISGPEFKSQQTTVSSRPERKRFWPFSCC